MNSENAIRAHDLLTVTTLAFDLVGHGITLDAKKSLNFYRRLQDDAARRFGRLDPANQQQKALAEVEQYVAEIDKKFNPAFMLQVLTLLPYVGFSDDELSEIGLKLQGEIQHRRRPSDGDEQGPLYGPRVREMLRTRRAALTSEE